MNDNQKLALPYIIGACIFVMGFTVYIGESMKANRTADRATPTVTPTVTEPAPMSFRDRARQASK